MQEVMKLMQEGRERGAEVHATVEQNAKLQNALIASNRQVSEAQGAMTALMSELESVREARRRLEGELARLRQHLPGPRMIEIPQGRYVLEDTWKVVDVATFWMDETPVTVAQYKQAVDAGSCTVPDTGDFMNWGVRGRENHPVNGVDWFQATAYAKWAGKRLPTEEEWEWAARGGDDGRRYPWGNDEPSNQVCWNGEGNDLGKGNRKSTSAVGSYPAGKSKHGVLDMAGNVWEWTSNLHDASNHSLSSARVYRGGSSYNVHPENLRAAHRVGVNPTDRYCDVGFRCAR